MGAHVFSYQLIENMTICVDLNLNSCILKHDLHPLCIKRFLIDLSLNSLGNLLSVISGT